MTFRAASCDYSSFPPFFDRQICSALIWKIMSRVDNKLSLGVNVSPERFLVNLSMRLYQEASRFHLIHLDFCRLTSLACLRLARIFYIREALFWQTENLLNQLSIYVHKNERREKFNGRFYCRVLSAEEEKDNYDNLNNVFRCSDGDSQNKSLWARATWLLLH